MISLQKYISLNQNTDFVRAYHRGKSFAEPALVVYVSKNRAGICRVGITVSKKTGNAVERNRSRRIIKAAFRIVAEECCGESLDIVFVARSKTKTLKSSQLIPVMQRLLLKAGVIRQ